MEVDMKCGFCKRGKKAERVCGKLHYFNKTAAHRRCMQYSANLVQYKISDHGGFDIYEVEQEIRRGRSMKCHICRKTRKDKQTGATAGCAIPSCHKTFHLYCAELDPTTLTVKFKKKNTAENIDMYSVFCGEKHFQEFQKNKGKEWSVHSKNPFEQQNCSPSCNNISIYDFDEENDDSDKNVMDTTPTLKKRRKETSIQNSNNSPGPAASANETHPYSNNSSVPVTKKMKKAHLQKSSDLVTKRRNECSAEKNNSSISIAMRKKKNERKECNISRTQAELRNTPPSSLASDSSEETASSNGQDDSDTEMISSPFTPSQKTKTMMHNISLPTMASGSSCEAHVPVKFPDCALVISSKSTLSSEEKREIIQWARRTFETEHVRFWIDFASSSIIDDYLLHFMKIISDMVSEKNFERLGDLLTEVGTQNNQIESMKYLIGLPANDVRNLKKFLLENIHSRLLNGELIMNMNRSLNILTLKLNDKIDRTCKIRGHINLPEKEEFSGLMYEWTDKTVLTMPKDDTDFQEEFEAIKCWLNQKCKGDYQLTVLPTDAIFTGELQNATILDLIMSMQQSKSHSSSRLCKNRVVLVQNLDNMINCQAFIQKLIRSFSRIKNPVFIVTSTQNSKLCTKDKIVPTNFSAGVDVHVLSTFNPSKKAVSCLIITINMTNQCIALSDEESEDEDFDDITPCEDMMSTSKLRKQHSATSLPQKKSGRI